MGEAVIEGSKWRLVEVGRVVVINGDHPYDGRLAAIVEIIDNKRVCSPWLRIGRVDTYRDEMLTWTCRFWSTALPQIPN